MPPAATTAFRTGGAANPPIDVKALGDRIGYLNVPAYSGGDATAARSFATKAHEQLAAAVDDAGCGWIVDLRGNTGGNMWPMLAGLKPFLGDEPLGTFVSREARARHGRPVRRSMLSRRPGFANSNTCGSRC